MSVETAPVQRFAEGKAKEIELKKAEEAKKMLERHCEIIGPGVIEAIAHREGVFAADEYTTSRMSGHANDNVSYNPGLKLFITPGVKDEIVERKRKQGNMLDESRFTQVNPQLFSIDFPDLVYSASRGAMAFYRKVGHNEIADMLMVYESIVRIETYEDGLWQNRDFDWNGAQRQAIDSLKQQDN